MGHVKLKASKEYKINFQPNELDNAFIPEKSKKFAHDYMHSQKLAEDDDLDIMLMFPDKVIYGFDYLYNNSKRIIVEINPVTVFFANSVMSSGMLQHYKDLLLTQAPDVKDIGKTGDPVNPNHAGMYFQLAINCVINLQATLESFANRMIPDDFSYVDKEGNTATPNITYKLYNALPIVKSIDFHVKKHRKYNISIDSLIKLRNNIIHLKPSGKTNTGYKGVYRDLLNFDFLKAILSVKTFMNLI